MAKKKCPPPGPNMSYMISFGDTMTALLAFFIVLNSLAEEQSGANMHAGTGSFVSATSSKGLPGAHIDDRSKLIVQHQAAAPSYIASDPTGQTEHRNGAGPHDEDSKGRVIDFQKDNFERFLTEAEKMSKLESATAIDAEIFTDVLGHLPLDGPLMNENIAAVVKGVAKMLRQPDREVELTVWCTAPAEGPWKRAVGQASQLRDETIALLRLPLSQQQKLTAVARPWPWSSPTPATKGLSETEKEKTDKRILRPAMSVTVRVTSTPTP